MTNIILVSGVGNSGKTESIRIFLNNYGLYFPDHPRDILFVTPIQKNGKTYNLGVASGGDTLGIVTINFNFFANHICDFIVCASKSRGATIKHVNKISYSIGNTLSLISTNYISTKNQALINAENARVALAIDNFIP